TFTVSKCNEERGTRDDISIWIDLSEAQGILGKPGRINAILALKCLCAGNELANVRRDVASVLPGAQVIEQGSKVLTRAEARDRASREAADALAAEVRNRRQLRDEQEKFSSILVPLVLLASALWVGLVFYANVRERRSEIGILRALGARARTILRLFLTKALLMGFTGGLAGYTLGTLAGLGREAETLLSFLDPRLLLLACCTAVVLSLAASWAPAYYAAQQDPAEVLREE
ncbi:MAG: FtsX-like permease family protein, partial [Acidobacteria bacterium]|nr:FtsX-like permease family protein [Acidobacteriota bacterium]